MTGRETSPQARRVRVEAATRPGLPALEPLLPDGRLPKGAVVEALDPSLLLALAAGPAAASSGVWAAVVGWPEIGLAAARDYGLPWERTLLVDDAGDHWAEVASTLADACETIILRPPERIAPRTTARLDAHLRRTGTVMLCHGRSRPGSALRLEVTSRERVGLGDGWGQLDGGRVEVRASGRGSAVHPLTARLWLPDAAGGVSMAETDTRVDGVPQPGAVAALA